MSLKDLTDDQLRTMLKDPKEFLKDKRNFDVVFDLTDGALRAKVEKFEKELDLPKNSLFGGSSTAK